MTGFDPTEGTPRARPRNSGSNELGRPSELADPISGPEPVTSSAEDCAKNLQRIIDFTEDLALDEPVDRVLEKIVEAVSDLGIGDRIFVILEQDQRLQVYPSGEKVGPVEADDRLKISRTLIRTAMSDNRTRVWNNLQKYDELKDVESIARFDISSAICVPVRKHGAPIGALYVEGAGLYDEDALAIRVLEAYTFLASLCITHSLKTLRDEAIRTHLEQERDSLQKEIQAEWARPMVGDSPAWTDVLTRIKMYADVDYSVLLTGESGTGKELVARALRDAGLSRRPGPFVCVNITAIPEGLIEGHLFGSVLGAYTNARDSEGFVQRAEGGTLFLDEIGDLPRTAQTKLLRFLEDKTYYRVGEAVERRANVRIVSATNRNLDEMVESDTFRRDLRHRIGHVVLHLPALSERREDIPALVGHVLQRTARESDRPPLHVAMPVLRVLMRKDWPGNVRELRHVVEAAEIWARASGSDTLDLDHLREVTTISNEDLVEADDAPIALSDALKRSEKFHIEAALLRSRGNVRSAAEELGVTRQTVYNRIKQFNIDTKKLLQNPWIG